MPEEAYIVMALPTVVSPVIFVGPTTNNEYDCASVVPMPTFPVVSRTVLLSV
jgi:hypothetical protein